MKKISTFLVMLLVSGTLFAQSQRLVLSEHFTQASCPPCALENPVLNPLMDVNAAKIVAVNYQTSWPGVDPMNAQNPTQVATRVTYYGVTGVPTAHMDGNGPSFVGYPAPWTQATIDNEYAVTSPFTISVSHTLSSNLDTIYCNGTITATGAVTGTLVAHMAVIERNVYFASEPGTNGEKHFPFVMKQMLPSDQGTSLPASFNVGDVQTLNYQWTLANVYNKNELAVVVWVQDNSNKHVHQAGYSAPLINDDAGITAVNVGVGCSLNIDPQVNLHNFAPSNPLTQVTVNYKIDAGTVQTYMWTGNLASNADALITLPTITAPSTGAHTITVYTSSPNGNVDAEAGNDQSSKSITIFAASIPAPITQDFALSTFPPSGFIRENVDGDTYQWSRSAYGNLGAVNGSAYMDFYYAAPGTIDNFYPPQFDYSSAVNGATLEFDLAHAPYSTSYVDTLKVNVSTDCGVTWTNVYSKHDPALETHTANVTTDWLTPTATTDWRHETVSMNSFIGQPNVLVQFKAISGNGNNIFIDNINIKTTPTGINALDNNGSIGVYPNPSNGTFSVKANFNKTENLKISVTNTLGQLVREFTNGQTIGGTYQIDMSNQPKGTYFVKVTGGIQVYDEKITIE